MNEYLHNVAIGLVAVLPVANPLTSISLLLGLGSSLSVAERNRQIFKASVYVALIMLVSFYGGSLVMKVFGISIPGLRIAGGLIVTYLGFTMLFPKNNVDETALQHDLLSDQDKVLPNYRDLSFVPLALPGTAGPGTIALIVSSASTLQSTYGEIPWVIHGAVVTVTLLTALIFWVALRCSGQIMKVLGESGIDAISRVVGFLLVGMGVQFVINGGMELVTGHVAVQALGAG
ncbi:MarC family NAAT transporter [Pseudomonas sp. Fl5BN2]|uniref:MarC family NAAT transporter n=1 Tax=Pseudomonas sp. Fl5BN2 TaxID=2697652 RepID=UPI0013769000|nr:MarC family NAAT transporter [Pseudomonas sp. Fl5BN2]NBF03421.1 MarC family NAAT transporter [Pseudomonas sp. Fl5BN2]